MTLPEIQAWADAYREMLPPPHDCPYASKLGDPFWDALWHYLMCLQIPFTPVTGPEYNRETGREHGKTDDEGRID
jgi:hypothetical protein